MRLVRVCLLGVACALACGGEGPDLDAGTAPEIWCRGLCEAERRCGIVSNGAPCETSCVSQRPGLASLSQDGARALRSCLGDLSCKALALEEEWDAALDVCWVGAMGSVDVASYARSFCSAYTEAWFECGSYWSVSECEHAYSMWTERVVERLVPCLDAVSCDALRACDERTWSTL
jgi:hypothetical protein